MARILIVDDDVMVRWRLINALTGLGHEVELAAEGAEALMLYKTAIKRGKPFSMVIMDLYMRDGSNEKGFLQEISNINSEAKCIISSAYIINGSDTEFEFKDSYEFLPKPYKIKDLFSVISRMT